MIRYHSIYSLYYREERRKGINNLSKSQKNEFEEFLKIKFVEICLLINIRMIRDRLNYYNNLYCLIVIIYLMEYIIILRANLMIYYIMIEQKFLKIVLSIRR